MQERVSSLQAAPDIGQEQEVRMPTRKLDAACAAAFLVYAAGAVITPVCLMTLARELDFGLLRGGLLESARTVLIVVALLLSGWAAARWGKSFSLGLGCVALGVGLTAYALTPGYGVLVLAVAVVGVGGGIVEGLVNPLIQDLHPSDSGRYLNFLNGFWSVGVLVTVLVGGDLLTRGVSWRLITAALGCFSFAVGTGFILLRRNSMPEGGNHGDVFRRKLAVLRHPRFGFFWIAMFLSAGVEGAFTFWTAAYIETLFSAEPRAGGVGTACFAAGMMTGRFAFGWLVGQRRLRRLILVSAACGLLISLITPMAKSPLWLSILLVPAGLSVACFWPSIQSYAADRIEADSTSLFILLSCGGIPGISVMAGLMGWIGERAGLWWSFLLIPLCFVLLIACMLAERSFMKPRACRNDGGIASAPGRPAGMFVFFLLLLTGPVFYSQASEANYREYLVGTRAAGMGGAVCADATLIDACFYNPAGLVNTEKNSISVSANVYGFQRFSIENSFYPGDDITTESFVSIPSAMGSVFRLNENIVGAFSAFVPSAVFISDMVVRMESRNFYNLSIQDQTLWFGPSIGCAVSENLSLGASLFGVYRTYSSLQSHYFADHGLSDSRNLMFRNFSVLSILGTQYRIGDFWRAGVALHTPSIGTKVMNSGEFEAHRTWVEDGRAKHDFVYSGDLYSRNRTPARLTTGVSCGKPGKYGLGLDITYSDSIKYTLLDGTFMNGEEASLAMRLKSVVDFSVGGEYYLNEIYPLRLGFFTSFSAASGMREGEDSLEKVDLYGMSLSIGRISKNIKTQIGLNYAFGSGTAHGYKQTETGIEETVVDMKESHLYLFFNTTYMF